MEQNERIIAMPTAANLLGDRELVTAAVHVAGAADATRAVQSVLQHYPDLEQLAAATVNEVAALPGLSSTVAQKLLLMVELGCRAQSRLAVRHGKVVSAGELGSTMIRHFAGRTYEEMLILYLDVKNQIIKQETVSVGGIESSLIDQRVLLRKAILYGAAQMIMVHNHPSGDPQPSSADISVTQNVLEASNLVGIALVDHLVIGSTDYVSFREHGYI
ncbi:JAB domain-containing protein [Lacticaseibacillus pantheris]|uniref:DNA repair protein RadC n=1 Tax=Lacticaseibacillus pantheris DSM 15945 = JCM 12539 = NBRC 106106 TaxID=1423783 RepID=A0A0R1TZY2_9LACO|nr:DNA repair protein RadC [Lacticaseibacillus pantheris]KRL84467.1 DNA repair protein RadC [Lacticaseibacillus pantheris DSM 15945 = JCM 12539 = NBRC 106106]WKF84881.1 DNA repair protein RadC [Lacticaseibacillus pantheris]